MNNPSTIQQLRDMKFSAMANELELQLRDPAAYAQLSFDDRLGLLVNAEWNRRQENKLKRRIHDAHMDIPSATLEGIEYYEDRGLDKAEMVRFATCLYIEEAHHVILKGATGSGKTYMACALGLEACKQRFTTKYVRLPDLLLELEMARADNTYKKALKKYANPKLLILDEWLLLKPTEAEQRDILELLPVRRKKSSTIFCSQYHDNGWYDQLGGDDSPLAEAILDRIKHDAYKIHIIPADPANYRSMREVYGLDKSLSE